MAYLYNFTKFVEWPKSALGDSSEAIVIGILGKDPFGPLLDQAIKERRSQGRPLRVVRYKTLAAAADCHLLFISRSEAKRQRQILAALADSSIVTVGETDDFTRDGGHIRFYLTDDQTIKIEVHPAAVNRAGVFISSRIMRIARIYEPAGKTKKK